MTNTSIQIPAHSVLATVAPAANPVLSPMPLQRKSEVSKLPTFVCGLKFSWGAFLSMISVMDASFFAFRVGGNFVCSYGVCSGWRSDAFSD